VRRLVLALVLVLGCAEQAAPAPSEAEVEPTPAPLAAPEAELAPAPEPTPAQPIDLQARADELAQRLIIVDGHVDLPFRASEDDRLGRGVEDVSGRTERGDFDWVRARAGGLDAPFMSIYTPARLQKRPGASKRHAEAAIDYVEALIAGHPDKFASARTPAEVRANTLRGLISLPLGMENGSPIERDLDNLAYFHGRGIRYITLTHSLDNQIADSSYSNARTHGGLSEFGREVVREMNRLGIMVDVAHVSDAALRQAVEISAVPVIASHSSCRHFTPGFERNVSDDLLLAMAAKGGVLQINFGGSFLSDEYRRWGDEAERAVGELAKERGLDEHSPELAAVFETWKADHPPPRVGVELVADHIEHAVAVAGIDYVGLGSDFDGVGPSLPEGLKDASMYPNLLRVLLERGWTEEQLEKLCSGNVFRVWQAVEDHARNHAAPTGVGG
jgi:membrane dipeptidase